MESKITDLEIGISIKVLQRTYNPAMIDYEELRSELLLWLVENERHLRRWRQMGRKGSNKLGVALRRHAKTLKVEAWIRDNPLKASYLFSESLQREIGGKFWEAISWKHRTPRMMELAEAYYLEGLSIQEMKKRFNITKQKLEKQLKAFEIEYLINESTFVDIEMGEYDVVE